MRPSYEEILEKLEELKNILEAQNQDKDYDETAGHVLTETNDLIDRAKPKNYKVYAQVCITIEAYSEEERNECLKNFSMAFSDPFKKVIDYKIQEYTDENNNPIEEE